MAEWIITSVNVDLLKIFDCCHIADTGGAGEASIVAVWERGHEMACESHYWALEGAKKEQKGWVGGPNDQGKEGCRQGTSNRKLEPTFCLQDFNFQIAQVKYRDQTRYNRFFDSKPLIETYYSIGVMIGHTTHRVEWS